MAAERRQKVVELINQLWGEGVPTHQHKAIIASRLGVSLRTVYNDCQRLTIMTPDHHCPLCGAPIRLERVRVDE